jgi:hypothetical protein
MVSIYTTQRCLQVEETYDVIANALIDEKNNLLELTEVMTPTYDFPNFETHTNKRKVLIQKKYIVEVVG